MKDWNEFLCGIFVGVVGAVIVALFLTLGNPFTPPVDEYNELSEWSVWINEDIDLNTRMEIGHALDKCGDTTQYWDGGIIVMSAENYYTLQDLIWGHEEFHEQPDEVNEDD